MTPAVLVESLSISTSLPDLSKLCPHAPGLDRHHDRLHGADLFIRDALFPGDAKIGLHSRVTGGRHCGREVDQEGRFLVEDLVIALQPHPGVDAVAGREHVPAARCQVISTAPNVVATVIATRMLSGGVS